MILDPIATGTHRIRKVGPDGSVLSIACLGRMLVFQQDQPTTECWKAGDIIELTRDLRAPAVYFIARVGAVAKTVRAVLVD